MSTFHLNLIKIKKKKKDLKLLALDFNVLPKIVYLSGWP